MTQGLLVSEMQLTDRDRDPFSLIMYSATELRLASLTVLTMELDLTTVDIMKMQESGAKVRTLCNQFFPPQK